MRGSAIRELAGARMVPLICAAFDESVVQVWDLSTQQKTGEFTAWFDFGARNMAMHPRGKSIVTGISRRDGRIASYETSTGKQMWLQDHVPYPAKIRFGPSGEYLFCTLDNRRVERVDAQTGDKTEVLRNTAQYVEGPDGYAFIAPSSASAGYALRNDHPIPIPRLTFAVLDIAFGTDRLCITESGGPVRCCGYQTGAEYWKYTPPAGSHVLALHHNRLDGFFYGILWHYETGDFRYLIRFDAETGQASNICKLHSWEEVFSESTQQLVTSSGEIIDLSSGEAVGELGFPEKEYPDRLT